QVVERNPEAARIIISGFSDHLKVAQCLTVGHRYFNKPLDFKLLIALLERVCSYNHLIKSDKLRRSICGRRALPSPPELYLRLSALIDSPYSDMDQIGKLVEQDAGASTK